MRQCSVGRNQGVGQDFVSWHIMTHSQDMAVGTVCMVSRMTSDASGMWALAQTGDCMTWLLHQGWLDRACHA